MEIGVEESWENGAVHHLSSWFCPETAKSSVWHLHLHPRGGKTFSLKTSHWIFLFDWLIHSLIVFLRQELVETFVGGLFSIRPRKLKRGGIELIEVVGIVLGEVYECLLVALFVSLNWFASASIEAITTQIKNHYPSLRGVSCYQLTKWKRSYRLTLEFIEEVDKAFGPALFVLVVKQFIFFVVYSYGILYQLVINGPIVFSCLYNMRNALLMLALIAGSQQMKNKVRLSEGVIRFQLINQKCKIFFFPIH